jgi:protease I
VIAGRTCNAYPALAPEVRAAGAEWAEVPIDGACVDGNLVTAPAWPAHLAWLAATHSLRSRVPGLQVLGTRIEP